MNIRTPLALRRWLAAIAVGFAAVAGLLAASSEAIAQLHVDVLHAFPVPGAVGPRAPLVQATDGNYYGTTGQGGTSNIGTVFQLTPGGTITTLHAFVGGSDGASPTGALVQATDGNLYGTTQNGGAFGSGTVFKITTTGTLTVIHSFNSQPGDGGSPQAGVIQATDGNLYGTTQSGGAFGSGTVFKITTTGTLTVLHAFSTPSDGGRPAGGLVQATDGNLYGTTPTGGTSGNGTVFKITTTGTLTVLHAFSSPSDGGLLQAGLVQATDGNLYGTTTAGGASGGGTVFQITTTGTFAVLHALSFPSDGGNALGGLIQATDGNLYGIANLGGPSGSGTVFKITTTGTLTVLHAFSGGADGAGPYSVIQGTDGNLWGTTNLGGPAGAGTIFKVTLAGTETVIDTFSAGAAGASPRAALVQLADGNFYGTTGGGGPADSGTVFQITPAGTLTTLHTFLGAVGALSDGCGPSGALVQAADGSLYGTTGFCGASGNGTVFKITTTGTLTVIHSFSFSSEGANSQGGLIQATDGNLYGTTNSGGPSGNGTLFKITTAGTLTVLHAFGFNDGTDGSRPAARLIQASDGNFYGTTQFGGASGNGTVFKVTPSGTYTVLHEFNSADGEDGGQPLSGLVQATDGNLYGTTQAGGASGSGTVFRITTAGTLSVLHAFNSFSDGGSPQGGLVQANDGNLYGTTNFGGASGSGTVFKITTTGTLTVVHAFSGNPDGGNSVTGVIQGTDGNFYGTSVGGGLGVGVVFRLQRGARSLTDIDGDGKADLLVYRPSTGQWFGATSSSNYSMVGSITLGGSSADTPVPGDYDGDGQLDAAVYRRSTGQWIISLSSNNNSGNVTYRWGRSNDIPVQGDYDGDGKTDLAVYRPSTGQWFILLSHTNNSMFAVYSWGVRTDMPVPADYDGDGKTDLAVYRRSTGQWLIAKSSSQYTTFAVYSWGGSTDIPVLGDYDGDGKTDLAVYRPSTGQWFIEFSGTGYSTFAAYSFGTSTDIPVSGDYDGDGKTDLAVYRPSTGQWLIEFSGTGYSTSATYSLGASTDLPFPAFRAGPSVSSISDTTRASDFDSDQKADLAVFRPSTGQWFIDLSGTNYSTFAMYSLGTSTDIPVSGDYDGDGKTDVGVYRPSTGQWLIQLSSTNYSTQVVYSLGLSTDTPVPGDYDGDGRTDVAVYRPSTGQWLILLSSTNYVTQVVYSLGLSTDKLVPGDYDGDGKTDPAVYRPSTGQWLMLLSSANYASVVSRTWGNSTDVPVPGDYDGDGLTDLAVYRASTGQWFVLQSSTGYTTFTSQQWGLSTDTPVPGDYDGDGKTDLAIYRASTGQWFVLQSSSGYTTYISQQWGASTDIPLVRRQ